VAIVQQPTVALVLPIDIKSKAFEKVMINHGEITCPRRPSATVQPHARGQLVLLPGVCLTASSQH
jgi:hypothetical protein